MKDNILKPKEKARKQFEVIFQRCIATTWGDCSEKDTITKFIHPMLKTLGWNILDFNEMREEVFAKPKWRDLHIDLVLYSKGKPYIGIEIKSLSYGSIKDETKDNVRHLLNELLQKSQYLDARYAILTRFAETLIFDPKTGNKLASFHSPDEHREKFDILWKYLSRPT